MKFCHLDQRHLEMTNICLLASFTYHGGIANFQLNNSPRDLRRAPDFKCIGPCVMNCALCVRCKSLSSELNKGNEAGHT